jgi:hypothetical protein
VAVDGGGRDVGKLGVGPARLVAQHLEGVSVVDRMTLHQDALGSLGDHSAAERALEVWYSANLRSTMSMALCHSSTSESVM